MKKIGHITSSYGRLVDLLAATLILKENPHTCLDCYKKLKSTTWIFPKMNSFPFIADELSRVLKIHQKEFWTLYRILTKRNMISKFFTVSQDDFNHIWKGSYGNLDLGNLLTLQRTINRELHASVDYLKSSTKGLIGFYARDNTWDFSMGQTHEYLKNENFRNPPKYQSAQFVDSLVNLGYGVIRLGRSSNPLFNVPKKNFFDYASDFSKTSDANDFYLWRQVDVGIASVGGACQPGFFFGKPFLIWDFAEPIKNIKSRLESYAFPNVILVPRYDEKNRNNFRHLLDSKFIETSIHVLLRKLAWDSLKNFGITKSDNFLIARHE